MSRKSGLYIVMIVLIIFNFLLLNQIYKRNKSIEVLKSKVYLYIHFLENQLDNKICSLISEFEIILEFADIKADATKLCLIFTERSCSACTDHICNLIKTNFRRNDKRILIMGDFTTNHGFAAWLQAQNMNYKHINVSNIELNEDLIDNPILFVYKNNKIDYFFESNPNLPELSSFYMNNIINNMNDFSN